MPANFESGFFGANEPAWHGLGVVIEDDMIDLERALEIGGLDWSVVQQPVWVPPIRDNDVEVYPTRVAEQYIANVRDKDGAVLGIVGSSWGEPYQPRQLYEFGESIIDQGGRWHTGGSLNGGAQVWGLIKLDASLFIAGEEIAQFLCVANGYNGTLSLTVANTDVRVVCENTLSMALSGAKRIYRLRHSKGLAGRVTEARKVILASERYGTVLKQLGESLAMQPVSDQAAEAFFARLVPMPPAKVDGKDNSRAVLNADQLRNIISACWEQSANLENIRATGWGLLNAVVEYEDHGRQVGGKRPTERRFERAVMEGAGLREHALKLLAPAGRVDHGVLA